MEENSEDQDNEEEEQQEEEDDEEDGEGFDFSKLLRGPSNPSCYAIDNMIKYNPKMKFAIVTDDVAAANTMLPEYPAYHDEIAWDYVAIKNARNVICSTATFACFPLWTSETLEYCIAPKYWFHHNLSQGWWSLGCSIYSYPSHYMDRSGNLFTPDECRVEWEEYKKTSKIYEGDLCSEDYSENIYRVEFLNGEFP